MNCFSIFAVMILLCCNTGDGLRLPVISSKSLKSSASRLGISNFRLPMARKIDEENAAMNKKDSSGGRNKKKGKERKIENKSDTETLVKSDDVKDESIDESPLQGKALESSTESTGDPLNEFVASIGLIEQSSGPQSETVDDSKSKKENAAIGAATGSFDRPLKVPKQDPLNQNSVPPEIVFFGEPRNPPPVEAVRFDKYHNTLLRWARHATVAPRTSDERLELVFPKGRLHPKAPKYRYNPAGLTYQKIFDDFVAVMDDLEESKAFIASNIDLVPSKMFLRAITAHKLTVQSKGDVAEMERLKEIRKRYIVAHDQIFFPLNIEIKKAETRVMTYVARDELRFFARNWDEVETTLHVLALVTARFAWEKKIVSVTKAIDMKMERTVAYMAKGMAKDMNREIRRPALTAEVYKNATIAIQENMPEFYAKVRPEVKLLHETFSMTDAAAIRKFALETFCPSNNVSPDLLKERLKIFDATVAAIQGIDYTPIRLMVNNLYCILCDAQELESQNKWYLDYYENGGLGFQTYERDTMPRIVKSQQRNRITGNAFVDFAVRTLGAPTPYTEAFSGLRPKGKDVGNWLLTDVDWRRPSPEKFDKTMEEFRKAYIEQSTLRQEAEAKLNKMIINRMEVQDRILGSDVPLVMDLSDSEDSADPTTE